MAEELRHTAETEWEGVKTFRGEEYSEEIEAVDQAFAGYQSLLDTSIAMYKDNPGDVTAAVLSMKEAADFFHSSVQPAQEALHLKETAKVQELVLGVNRMLPTAIILGVIALFVSTGAAYFIGRGIVSAATHLREAAESISRGNLDVSIKVTTGDEMEDLAGSLERMRKSLELAVKRLQSKKRGS
jgi:methyl-accepting chemotaxis protein